MATVGIKMIRLALVDSVSHQLISGADLGLSESRLV